MTLSVSDLQPLNAGGLEEIESLSLSTLVLSDAER